MGFSQLELKVLVGRWRSSSRVGMRQAMKEESERAAYCEDKEVSL
jgi:hypothetical protein